MKRILTLFAAVAAAALFTQFASSEAAAQCYSGGYQFGAGLNQFGGGGFGWGAYVPREQPPYFASHPPVYYSHVVKRPYGVSPYAAPAGIAPIEMSIAAPEPAIVHNPYFGQHVEAPVVEALVQPEQTFTKAMPKKKANAKANKAAPKKQEQKAKAGKNENQKTTWIRNAFFDTAI